jgi:hypothetical protein
MRLLSSTVLGAAALLLVACGTAASPGGSGPAQTSSVAAPPPSTIPAATGPVTGVGMVIDVAGSPELCLGPVMESFPPQCDGVPLGGWDWTTAGIQEEAPAGTNRPTRWGTYAVTGPFDGSTMTVSSSVPLALYDPVAPPTPEPVTPPRLTVEEWAGVEAGVRRLPGLLTSMREGDVGPVLADVVHDDGTLQGWADTTFGAGAVRVTSMLS